MRQAGRYMPEYRRIRQDHSILEICKTPNLAAEVTLQPVDILDVDAAIIFADLLLPLEPMGLQLEFVSGEGPVIHNPVRTPADVDALETRHSEQLSYVGEAIAQAKRALDGRVPLIGFVGAPFTLASYMIEGGSSRHYLHAKGLMYSEPKVWRRLMEKLIEILVPYTASQVSHGADVIQVFDSWVGALSPEDYRRHVLPYSQMLIRAIQSTGVPVIHFSTGGGGFLPLLHEAGGDVLGRVFAPLEQLRERVEDILCRAGDRPGYIFNLGHGILPETPVDNVKAVVQMVREYQREAVY
jgi:uroporphyrinogen decarboxylase